jgi:diguanylate cyclase (GGDEF)-like protein
MANVGIANRESASEAARLAALHRYDILDSDPEAAFDRITRLASDLFGMPIATVSLIDKSRQWFKSRVGIDAAETERDISFCTHAIEDDQVMVVPDATHDPRFAGNPFVQGNPNIRFYAGAPLKTPDGYNIGTLCVIDNKPREISEAQKGVLAQLANLVVQELELRRAATTDPLTGALNRRSFNDHATKEITRAQRYGRPLIVGILDIDHFKQVNDTYGHDAGDTALKIISDFCQKTLREQDMWARLGGEEFGIILVETGAAGAAFALDRLREGVANLDITANGKTLHATVSIGAIEYRSGDLDDALKRADHALYEAKESGRNRVRVVTMDDGA